MSNQNHPWCRDVSRDEAIRAAEDDAANWRRLEVGEVVQEGDEYLDPYGIWKDVTGVTRGKTYDSRTFADHRRRRVPLPDHRDLPAAVADLRRRVEGLETLADHWRRQCEADADAEKREAAVVSRDSVNADGLRTERVTLEITQRAESYAPCRDLDWQRMLRQTPGGLFPGESVRVVDDDLPAVHDTDGDRVVMSWPELAKCLTAERDAALRERDAARADVAALQRERDEAILVLPACCGRLSDAAATVIQERDAAKEECERLRHLLKTKESECETHHPWVHPSAAPPAANAGVEANCPAAPDSSQEPVAWGFATPDGKLMHVSTFEPVPGTATVVPLFAAPQPPRGWLTEEERTAVKAAVIFADQHGRTNLGVALDALLARSPQPPRGWLTDEVRLALMDAADRLHNYDSPGPRHSALVIRRFLEGTPDAPPRGWLTEEEREAIHVMASVCDRTVDAPRANILRALLARETPPRVKMPPAARGETPLVRDLMWGQAIREAGGEVG